MTEDRCELTELLVAQCGHCQGHTVPSVRDFVLYGQSFAASYGGQCSSGDHRFSPGDEICRVTDAWHRGDVLGYCCSDCLEELRRE